MNPGGSPSYFACTLLSDTPVSGQVLCMIVIFSLISAFSAAVYVILRTMPLDETYEFFQFIGEMRIVYFRPLSMIPAFGTALGDKHRSHSFSFTAPDLS